MKSKANKEKPRYNELQNTAFMLKTAREANERKVIVIAVLTAVFTLAVQVTEFFFTPTVLAALENHKSASQLILTIAAFSAGIMIFSAAVNYIENLAIFPGITVRSRISAELSDKTALTSYQNLGTEGYDTLLNKSFEAVNANSSACEAIWTTYATLLTNVLAFAVFTSLLVRINLLLVAVVTVTTVVSYYVNKRQSDYVYKHREESSRITKKLNYFAYPERSMALAKDIRIFGLRPWLRELSDKVMDEYTAFQSKAESAYLWARLFDVVLTFLRNGVAYVYLIAMVINGEIEVSQFLLLFSAVGEFTARLSSVFGTLNTLHRQSLDISTVRELLDYDEPFRFEDGLPLDCDSGTPHELILENVSFRYPGAEKNTLSGINLTLHPGEKLAIVGLNGAGKSTLIKILCGFYDPTEGRVLLDGHDIRDYNRRDYYRLFSAVFQDFSLIAGTAAQNVAQTLDASDIDLDRVRDCIEKAGLTKKLSSLPDGLNTLLNREVYEDAAMLSGGETQRLMLARALYKDGPFVILDEPTAALDPIAEADMYLKYNSMTQNKSSVYISHRLASTRFCDRIILIDNAVIAEEGTHDELMKAGGKYASLFEVQSKYYKEDGDRNE